MRGFWGVFITKIYFCGGPPQGKTPAGVFGGDFLGKKPRGVLRGYPADKSAVHKMARRENTAIPDALFGDLNSILNYSCNDIRGQEFCCGTGRDN